MDFQDASVFDRRVYEETLQVPVGKTVTYGDLAVRIKRPRAARAVGGALGRNPVPLLIPCHRVVGVGQSLVGFSAPGGTRTKQRLLDLESALVAD